MTASLRVTRRQVLRYGGTVLAGLGVACRLPPLRDVSGGASSLRFYSPRFTDPLVAQAFQGLLDEFEGAHPGATVLTETEPVASQARYTLRHRAAAGQSPDLVGHVYLPSLVQDGLARTLTIDAALRHLWDDLPELQQAAATVEGQVYGLPIEVTSSSALFYRRSGLARAGMGPPSTPLTWANFVSQAQRATLGSDQRGFALIAQPSIEATYAHWYDWFASAGGDQYAPDGRIALDRGDAGLETLRLYANLSVGVHATLPNSTELDETKAGEAFAAGSGALIQDGSSRLAWLKAVHPEVAADLGVVPLPWQSRDVSVVRTETVALGATTPRPDLARELASFLASATSSVRRFELAGLLPPSRSARPLARGQATPLERFFLDRLAGPTVAIPGDVRLPSIVARGGLMVHDVICGCVKPEEALQKAVADMSRLPAAADEG
jgi:ABC-type glycerol-3-phosphate transport system substrate-binding protein